MDAADLRVKGLVRLTARFELLFKCLVGIEVLFKMFGTVATWLLVKDRYMALWHLTVGQEIKILEEWFRNKNIGMDGYWCEFQGI